MNDSARRAQSGNILFYILIAIALLAALSFAVAQSNRGNLAIVNEEKARLKADEMLEYSNILANAVVQLRLRGCKDTELSFQNNVTGARFTNASAPPDRTCHVFDKAGGGVVPRNFQRPDGTNTDVLFQTGTQAINQIGIDAEPDIWMRVILDGTEGSHAICTELNKLVKMGVINDLSTAGFEPLEDGSWTDTDFAGTYPAAAASNRPNVNGRTAWCAGHNVSLVSFYRVLLAR